MHTPASPMPHYSSPSSPSMNYKWTISLHDGYPPFHILSPEEYIPPSLHTLCYLKPTMFHLSDDYLCPHKFLLPPEDNGEKLRARVTRNVVEVTEKADWERVEKFSYILGIMAMGNSTRSHPVTNLWTIWMLQSMRKT